MREGGTEYGLRVKWEKNLRISTDIAIYLENGTRCPWLLWITNRKSCWLPLTDMLHQTTLPKWLTVILNISWKDMVCSDSIQEQTGQEKLELTVQERLLKWLGHIQSMTKNSQVSVTLGART